MNEITFITKIKRYGTSTVITIPAEQVDIMQYTEGAIIEVTIRKLEEET